VYCHNCGQEAADRLTVPGVLAGLSQQFASLDFALLRTVFEATTHPGRLARVYVEGRRQPYASPIGYAFLTGTVLALTIGLADFAPWLASASTSSSADFASFIAQVGPALPYVFLVGLLPTAWVHRWLLRRETRRNVAECYVLLLYTSAQAFLFSSVVVLVGVYGTPLGNAVTGAAAVGYLFWGLMEFEALGTLTTLGVALVVFLCAQVFGTILGWAWIVAASAVT
jgi:hypothetical protein